MMAVISNPINNPVKGLDVARIIVSAADFPRCCRDDTINSSANTKSTRVPNMYNALRMLSQVLGAVLRSGCIGVAGSNQGPKNQRYEPGTDALALLTII